MKVLKDRLQRYADLALHQLTEDERGLASESALGMFIKGSKDTDKAYRVGLYHGRKLATQDLLNFIEHSLEEPIDNEELPTIKTAKIMTLFWSLINPQIDLSKIHKMSEDVILEHVAGLMMAGDFQQAAHGLIALATKPKNCANDGEAA